MSTSTWRTARRRADAGDGASSVVGKTVVPAGGLSFSPSSATPVDAREAGDGNGAASAESGGRVATAAGTSAGGVRSFTVGSCRSAFCLASAARVRLARRPFAVATTHSPPSLSVSGCTAWRTMSRAPPPVSDGHAERPRLVSPSLTLESPATSGSTIRDARGAPSSASKVEAASFTLPWPRRCLLLRARVRRVARKAPSAAPADLARPGLARGAVGAPSSSSSSSRSAACAAASARARAASSHLRASGYLGSMESASCAARAQVVGRHVMLSPRKRAGEDRAARARLEVDDCGVARGPCVVGRSVGGVSARHLTTASAFRARVFVTLGDSS